MPAKVPTPKPAEIARLRRSGSTWAQVREATGTKFNSTRIAAIMAAENFNPAGIKAGSKQTSKAISRANGGAKPAPPRGKAA